MRQKSLFDLCLLLVIVLLFAGKLYLQKISKVSLGASYTNPQTYGTFFAPSMIATPIDEAVASRASWLTESLTCEACLVVEKNSKQILLAKNATTPHYPASTTKIITALVANEIYPEETLFTLTAADLAAGNILNLRAGEVLSKKELLEALLIASANEAGTIFANHSPGGYQDFVAQMNSKAKRLNLSQTHFTNPQGYDDYLQQSSAKDLALASLELLRYPNLSQIVAKNSGSLRRNGKPIYYQSTNQLFFLPHSYQVKGIKTGTEKLAKQVLVSLLAQDNHELLVVVLSAQNRYNDTLKLADFTFSNFVWRQEQINSL